MAATEVGTLEKLWAQKLTQLHGLAVSIATERQRGNEAGVSALREVFVRVVADLRAIAERIRVQESALNWVEGFLDKVDSGLTDLGNLGKRGWGEIKGLVVFAVLAALLLAYSPAARRSLK